MACPRCGTDCNCACSGDPLPNDWRREVSMQVRAHRARRRNINPDALQLDFQDPEVNETSVPAMRARNSRWDQEVFQSASTSEDAITAVEEQLAGETLETRSQDESSHVAGEQFEAVPQERLPLAPFPRIAAPARKVIQFPRNQMLPRQYELAEPVADQLRIFEAVEEIPPPPPTHLAEIEIAPEEPTHARASDLDLPLQTASLARRTYAAALDGLLLLSALGIFAECAKFFAGAFVLNKSLLANGCLCAFLLLGLYFFLSLSFTRSTVGIRAAGMRLSTFAGKSPSRNLLRWRALAIALCYATLGMGFAWAFIDEDRLCWHDRITRTHLRREEGNKQ
jgi:uncharacterized RDD family membrane protein YckC